MTYEMVQSLKHAWARFRLLSQNPIKIKAIFFSNGVLFSGDENEQIRTINQIFRLTKDKDEQTREC